MRVHGIGHTDIGKKRQQNEDSFFANDDLGLYVVSDGMGGHAAGEVASSMAVATAERIVRERWSAVEAVRDGGLEPEELASIAREAVQEAAREVYDRATSPEGSAGMGCTLTVLLVAGSAAAMGHVGDSRLYLCRDGTASQLSMDHTLAQELLSAGLFTAAELKVHPYAHVLSRSVGQQPAVQVDTLVFDVLPGDRLLLCTDGLTEYLPGADWLANRMREDKFDSVAETLVQHANEAGGHDNITAVVVRIDADEAEEPTLRELRQEVHGKLEALDSVFLFEDLSLALKARVLEACALESFEGGAKVIAQGAECDSLFVVVEGRFELSRDGERLGLLDPGEYTGITTLLHPRPARATLRVVDAGKLLRLDRTSFWRLVRLRPWLGAGLLERLGRRLSATLDLATDQPDTEKPPRLFGERF